MSRRDFWVALIIFALFVAAYNWLLRQFEPEQMIAFWLALPFPFLAIYVIYCIYGKRLHDMGRSVWPVTAMIAAQFLAVIAVMLTFGGAEYFAAFSEFDRKEAIDPDVVRSIREPFEAEIAANLGKINGLLLVIPLLMTAWIGLSKPDPKSNKYGPPLN